MKEINIPDRDIVTGRLLSETERQVIEEISAGNVKGVFEEFHQLADKELIDCEELTPEEAERLNVLVSALENSGYDLS